jgi:3-oxoadipate enol-lactonase
VAKQNGSCILAPVPFVNTRIARLHYEETPSQVHGGTTDGPTVVLLHGMLMDNAMWKHQVPALSKVARVIALEGPGHGKSAPGLPATLETQADAVADALEALGITRAVICGLSWGGMIAMRVAIRHPQRTAGLVLCGTAGNAWNVLERTRTLAYARILERVPLQPWMVKHLFVPRMYGAATRKREPHMYREVHARIVQMDQPALREVTRSIANRSNALGDLTRYKGPALIVCGERDRVTPIWQSALLARALPQAKFVRLPKMGQFAPYEAPEVVNEELAPFVAGCVAAG